MRSIGILCWVCLGWLLAGGQPAPVSFPATYTYTVADGLPAGGNFALMVPLPDGSWLVQPWTKPLVRVTSTGIYPLYYDSSLKAAGFAALRAVSGSDEWFIQDGWGLLRRRGDTLFSKPEYQKGNAIGWACMVGRYLLCTIAMGNQSMLYRFDGLRWDPLPLPDNELAKTGGVSMTVVREDRVRVLAHNPGNSGLCKIYELNEQSWQLREVQRFMVPEGAGAYKLAPPDTLVLAFNGDYFGLVNGTLIRKPWRVVLAGGHVLAAPANAKYSTISIEGSRELLTVGITDRIQGVAKQQSWPSYLVGTAGGLHRVFPYVKHYPQLYAGVHAQATHSLMQMDNGELYAGSYGGYLSAITPAGIMPVKGYKAPVLPGGAGINNSIYFFAESMNGFWQLSKAGGLSSNKNAGYAIAGFYLQPAANGKQLYAGLSGYKGIGIVDIANLEAGRATWRFADSTKGVRLMNILTIAEDPLGRLWFGRPSEGWGVYNPTAGKGITYRMAEGQTSFGAMASAVDSKGTVWLGGRQGLHLADGRKPGLPTPAEVGKLQHPLLADGMDINAVRLWKQHLLIGIGKRLLLLDLADFYQHKAAISAGKRWARIRYLSPQELGLTSEVEQNCLLVDKRDSSVWLATNNMLYQIDMTARVQLPSYLVKPTLQIIAGIDTMKLLPGRSLSLPPTSNSLQISLRYQTPDNLPRLVQMALQAEGDSIIWTEPGTTYQINALNRQTGHYQLHIRVFELDGSISYFVFPISIRKFLWQQWWFWLLLSLAAGSAVFYAYYLYKQKQLAEANAARITAEAEALKADQQRRLTTLQVKSLSNQFRPHFILNALNTVGAQLYDKPEVDEVLGQLGDSIGIIFKNAQQGSVAHALTQEWQLVQSVINIKQLEYQQSVEITDDLSPILNTAGDWLLPMGILQIPVENALIHGLRNKEAGSKNLWLRAELLHDELHISIADNGVGRQAAAAMTNYRSNGVGSRNLQAIIELLNAHNTQKISYTIIDRKAAGEEAGGTEVKICIPRQYNYEI